MISADLTNLALRVVSALAVLVSPLGAQTEALPSEPPPAARYEDNGPGCTALTGIACLTFPGRPIPIGGMGTKHLPASHESQLGRLKRVEGQVRGITRMVEERRYCVEILTQLRAARAALRRIEADILGEHTQHCVAEALAGRDRRKATEKVNELVDLLSRFGA